MRPYSTADYAQLKSATKRAIELAGGPVALAKETRLDQATLSRAGNIEHSNFLPIDAAVDADRLAGEPVILRALARIAGFDLVPIKARHESANLVHDAGTMARESGELVSSAIEATADGTLTAREAREIDREAQDVEAVVASVRRQVHGVMAAAK